jgi:hypothetical protein
MNLFLGLYVPCEGTQNIWDLPTDHFLHNADPRHKVFPESYMDWWKTALGVESKSVHEAFEHPDDSRFIDYYRPKLYTTFADHFAFDIMGTMTR